MQIKETERGEWEEKWSRRRRGRRARSDGDKSLLSIFYQHRKQLNLLRINLLEACVVQRSQQETKGGRRIRGS